MFCVVFFFICLLIDCLQSSPMYWRFHRFRCSQIPMSRRLCSKFRYMIYMVLYAYCNELFVSRVRRWDFYINVLLSYSRSSMLIFVPSTLTISRWTYAITTSTCFQWWWILLVCRVSVIGLLMALLLSSWLSSAVLLLDTKGHLMLQKGLHKKLRWVYCPCKICLFGSYEHINWYWQLFYIVFIFRENCMHARLKKNIWNATLNLKHFCFVTSHIFWC